MQNIFTSKDLLPFLYGEFNPQESRNFLAFIESNEELKMELEELKSTMDYLDSANFLPSKSSLDLIMEFSESTSHQEA